MKIAIICFGKLDSKEMKLICNDYINRISKFAGINIVEIKEPTTLDDKKNVILSENILNKLLKESYSNYKKILFAIDGIEISSEQISLFLKNIENFTNNKIVFIIGPSYGFSKEFVNKFDVKWSFGKITYPHQLFRIIVCEQIYRGFKIKNNQKYHK